MRAALTIGAMLVAIVVVVYFLSPGWLCAPFLLSDLVSPGDLPPPLPARCQPTSDAPSAATLNALAAEREAQGLTFQGRVSCRMAFSDDAERTRDQQWISNLYAGGALEYRRHVLLAAQEPVAGGVRLTIEICLMPWPRFVENSRGHCWESQVLGLAAC